MVPVPAASGSVYITSEYIKVSSGDVLNSNRSMRFINFYDSDKNIFRLFQQLMLSLRLHRQRM